MLVEIKKHTATIPAIFSNIDKANTGLAKEVFSVNLLNFFGIPAKFNLRRARCFYLNETWPGLFEPFRYFYQKQEPADI